MDLRDTYLNDNIRPFLTSMVRPHRLRAFVAVVLVDFTMRFSNAGRSDQKVTYKKKTLQVNKFTPWFSPLSSPFTCMFFLFWR